MAQASRLAYLQAMGIEVYVPRQPPERSPEPAMAPADEAGVGAKVRSLAAAGNDTEAEAEPVSKACIATQESDIATRESEQIAHTKGRQTDEDAKAIASSGWEALQARAEACQACRLAAGRTRVVFGSGDKAANVLVIGEAPGEQEDRQGEPFVGRAGQLLDAMLLAAGLCREQVYIANTVKCRPPGNRDPAVEEIQACSGWLERQIELIQPRVILVLGRVAAHAMLDSDEAIARLRGGEHTLPGSQIPLLVSYHPAYLLRQPSEKAKSWQDLQLLMGLLREGDARS